MNPTISTHSSGLLRLSWLRHDPIKTFALLSLSLSFNEIVDFGGRAGVDFRSKKAFSAVIFSRVFCSSTFV